MRGLGGNSGGQLSGFRWLVISVLIGAGWVLPPCTRAQQGQRLWTLKQSIEVALERNLQVRVAREEIEAARESQNEARTGFLPSLSAQYGYLHHSEAPTSVSGGNRVVAGDQNQYSLTGTITQPLFTGFATLSSYRLATLGLDVAGIELERTRLDLILQVKEAYFGVLSAEKIRGVAKQSVLQLQSQLEVAENFYRVGMSPKIDVLEAEVRLAEAEQQLVRSENDLRLAKARFNTILREPLDGPVEVEDILSSNPYPGTYESSQEIAMQNRPELREAEKKVASAEQEITLAQSDYYPKVSLSANYNRAGDEPTVEGSPYVDRENWDVVAVATVSLFEWGKTRSAVNRQRARFRQAKEALDQVKESVRLEVKTAFLNLETAEKNIAVAQKSVASAEENFRISSERYKVQVATATEVLDAQTRLTQARTTYTNTLVDFNVAKARLLRAMGLGEES
jgi:outer membrane protein